MRIAIDTGGTFTDCVFVHDGALQVVKVFSTPQSPALALAHALKRIAEEWGPVDEQGGETNVTGVSARAWRKRNRTGLEVCPTELICGATVGTNALLERRGGRVALVTTAGFEDVLEIGRQARPRLYDFFVERPGPLVPRARRFGLRERLACDGGVLRRPSRREVARAVRAVERSGAEAAAVCLLFSFVNPAHEQALARALRRKGWLVSVSCEILPEFREFERASTTVVNAYLAPVMSRYLGEIETHARRAARGGRAAVRIMQSNGGIISASVAAREPVRTVLSGPAGGVVGAQYLAALSGFERIISFDMGGTSTDVALLEGAPAVTNEGSVAGLPVAVPILDIHTVGAGGGSIARFDRAGALRVGPESAGADPGPICYGRGEQPTVTDAHLLLGHIPADHFLGSEFRLDETRARRWMQAACRGRSSAEAFAQGIVDVANATMEKAIRVISVERGYDPRDYTLVAFGGAGGLHACDLAAALGMPAVLIPRMPGALSALGILRADVVRDFSRTVQRPAAVARHAARELAAEFHRLERLGRRELAGEGFAGAQVRSERWLDMRYPGQAYELAVRATGDFVRAFHAAHERRYGYADARRTVEIVTVRARLLGATPKPPLARKPPTARAASAAQIATRRAVFGARRSLPAVYDRALLRAGMRFAGPAIVVEYSATTVLPPGWRARVDGYENIVLSLRRAARTG